MHHGRKSCPFATRTVLPATRTSLTLADSFFAERKRSLGRPISTPWRTCTRTSEGTAPRADEIADRASRRRTRGRIFAAVKLHPRPVPLRGVLVLVRLWRKNIEPPRSALAQPGRGLRPDSPSGAPAPPPSAARQSQRRSRGNHLRRQRRIKIVLAQPQQRRNSLRIELRAKLRIALRHLAEESDCRPCSKRTGTGPHSAPASRCRPAASPALSSSARSPCPASDGRQRQLFLRGEDAHAHALGLLHTRCSALDERGLGKIELARDRLHLSVVKPHVFITTASGLPASGSSVKTSTTK